MNAQTMARMAYSSAAAPTRTAQGVEYEAFAKVTARLKSYSGRGREGFPGLAAALSDNRRLWTILALDVADPENKLPELLRAQILSLAEFTQAHTAQVLMRNATAAALIDINTSIMRGLRQQEPAR